MDGETFVPDQNEQSQGSFDGTNGATQPVAEQVQTPQPTDYLSKSDFEKWQRDNDAQWQARLQETLRQNQVKSDKARDTAIRKAQAFENDYVKAMQGAGIQIEPQQIAAIKNQIINQEFWQPEPEPTAPQYVPQTTPNAVSADEVAQHMQTNYGYVDQNVAAKYAGRDRNDTSWLNEYYADAAAARTRQDAARKLTQQQQQNAQAAQQVRAGFGTTGTLQPGAPSTASEAQARIQHLMNQKDVTPAQDIANWKEIDALEKKLRDSGQWKDESYQW